MKSDMKTTLLPWILFATALMSQVTLASTNLLSASQAVVVVSQLYYEMDERLVDDFLKTNGLSTDGFSGCNHGWTRTYSLPMWEELFLQYRPKGSKGEPDQRNGVLVRAYVRMMDEGTRKRLNKDIPLRKRESPQQSSPP